MSTMKASARRFGSRVSAEVDIVYQGQFFLTNAFLPLPSNINLSSRHNGLGKNRYKNKTDSSIIQQSTPRILK